MRKSTKPKDSTQNGYIKRKKTKVVPKKKRKFIDNQIKITSEKK